MRPDIAQAIHDAAVSEREERLRNVAFVILSAAFLSGNDWYTAHHSNDSGFYGWLRTDEGRTYMLFVAEALS